MSHLFALHCSPIQLRAPKLVETLSMHCMHRFHSVSTHLFATALNKLILHTSNIACSKNVFHNCDGKCRKIKNELKGVPSQMLIKERIYLICWAENFHFLKLVWTGFCCSFCMQKTRNEKMVCFAITKINFSCIILFLIKAVFFPLYIYFEIKRMIFIEFVEYQT